MSKQKVEDVNFGPDAGINFERDTGTDSSQAITQGARTGVVTSSTTNLGTDTSEKITITNRHCKAESVVLANADGGGAGSPAVTKVTPKDGSIEITVRNVDASNACDAAYKVQYVIFGDQSVQG